MNKMIAISAMALIFGISGQALAQNAPAAAPATPITTVAAAQQLRDDTKVVMQGTIEQVMGNEKYMFKDKTGSVVIDIDNEDLRGVNIIAGDKVEVYGEVDHEHGTMEVEAEVVIKK